jgi:hypothetical protein
MGAYSGMAPLMSYKPGAPFHPAANGNPELVEYAGFDHAWRPQAMIAGPEGRVYVGATAGYGKLQGPLLAWTGEPESVQVYDNIVPDQSVVSLAATSRLIIGGTTALGGGGSHPTATDAHVFTWSPSTKSKLLDVVPVPGATEITDLVVSRNGVVWGMAVHGADHTLFSMDALTGAIRSRSLTSFHNLVYNGIGLLADGAIVGLAESGVFTIDELKGEARLVEASPVPVTGGFALRDDTLFFLSNANVYSVTLKVAHAP